MNILIFGPRSEAGPLKEKLRKNKETYGIQSIYVSPTNRLGDNETKGLPRPDELESLLEFMENNHVRVIIDLERSMPTRLSALLAHYGVYYSFPGEITTTGSVFDTVRSLLASYNPKKKIALA